MVVLENALAAVRHDYSVLRMEFERTVASNEQAGPIAKELRVTVDSLQKTITQHKSEVNRYKTRAHKAEQQLAKVWSVGGYAPLVLGLLLSPHTQLQEDREKEGKDKAVVSGADKDVSSELGKGETVESGNVKSSYLQETCMFVCLYLSVYLCLCVCRRE